MASLASTQAEINHEFNDEAMTAICAMRNAYRNLLQSVSSNTSAAAKLGAARARWVAYRDAHLDERFPHQDEPMYYGSVLPMCTALAIEEVTIAWRDELQRAGRCGETDRTAALARQAARTADAALNVSYRKVISAYADDPTLVTALRRAEMAWVKFRDGWVDFIGSFAGGIDTACAQTALERVVRSRKEALDQWLRPQAQGDICIGSYRRL